MTKQKGQIFIISDSTGETASMMTKAALVHFADSGFNIFRCKNVRSKDQIESLVSEAFNKRGFIIHTIASQHLRDTINELAIGKNIPTIDLLGPLLKEFTSYFESESNVQPGLLRNVDERYFKRIEAIEYTVRHDDGKSYNELDQADIVLVGISRTSKTPLSIFLSHKGWKVANIPLVVNAPLPEELFKIDQKRIVGLIIDHDSLHRIRRKRLEKFGQDPGSEYASYDYIEKEIEYATELFKQNKKWPVFNVTDRALEETAAEIIKVVATRLNLPFDQML